MDRAKNKMEKSKKNSDKNCNTQTHSNCAETYVNESFRFVLAIAGDLAEHVCSGKLNGMERKKCVPTKYHATLAVLERHKIAITTATRRKKLTHCSLHVHVSIRLHQREQLLDTEKMEKRMLERKCKQVSESGCVCV